MDSKNRPVLWNIYTNLINWEKSIANITTIIYKALYTLWSISMLHFPHEIVTDFIAYLYLSWHIILRVHLSTKPWPVKYNTNSYRLVQLSMSITLWVCEFNNLCLTSYCIYTIKSESYCLFYLSILFSLLTLHVSLREIK